MTHGVWCPGQNKGEQGVPEIAWKIQFVRFSRIAPRLLDVPVGKGE